MPHYTVSRQAIIDALHEALEPQPYALAGWLGGSDASGRTDAFSDVDIQFIVAAERIEDAYAVAHGALESLSPIAHRFRFPQPTWHGHEQELIQLQDADPCHFIDFVLMKPDAKGKLLEPERHGEAMVLFDKGDHLRPDPFDEAAHLARMQKRLKDLRELFPLLQNVVTKAALRGHHADAAHSYVAHCLRLLVELLRMRYSPARFDYGLRYLDRDLPPDMQREIEELSFPGSVAAVETYRTRAEALFRRTIAELDDGVWVLRAQ